MVWQGELELEFTLYEFRGMGDASTDLISLDSLGETPLTWSSLQTAQLMHDRERKGARPLIPVPDPEVLEMRGMLDSNVD